MQTFISFVRPWSKDQTLLVKHLKLETFHRFATSFQKTCLKQSLPKNVLKLIQEHQTIYSACQEMFCDLAKHSNIA